MAIPSDSYYESNVFVTLGIWVRRSGAWQKVTSVYTSYYNNKSTADSSNYSARFNGSVQLGGGIEAFGVTIDGVDGGTADDLTFNGVSWTAQGSSGSPSSALADGATTTITVMPK